jgi:hypothetical protein
MSKDDPLRELRELAEAGERVFGPEEKQRSLFTHHCRPGNWLCFGAWPAIAATYYLHWPSWVLFVVALAAGWVANEWEERTIQKRLRAEIAAGR